MRTIPTSLIAPYVVYESGIWKGKVAAVRVSDTSGGDEGIPWRTSEGIPFRACSLWEELESSEFEKVFLLNEGLSIYFSKSVYVTEIRCPVGSDNCRCEKVQIVEGSRRV